MHLYQCCLTVFLGNSQNAWTQIYLFTTIQANERFPVDLLPSFDEAPVDASDCEDDDDPTKNPYRLHHLVRNTREDSSIFAAGRSFLPARNNIYKTTISPF